MYLFLILLSLGAVKAHLRTVRDPGPAYNCSYCQPEQIHIAFGGKFLIYLCIYFSIVFSNSIEALMKNMRGQGTFVLLAENKTLFSGYKIIKAQSPTELSIDPSIKYPVGNLCCN